jgi:cytochrome c oxidase assembly protein subunit 15
MLVHLFALLVACSTAILIFAGGLVTSTESGLSVPDWPNTYGWFMFFFPIEKMVGGIFYEHSHRLIASTVGFLILVQAIVLWRVESRQWVRRLGFVALAAVITQGLLGGITVLWYLPRPISIAHASLAQLVFCLAATIALATSPGWRRGYARSGGSGASAEQGPPHSAPGQDPPYPLRRLAVMTTALIYLQIVIGATMRHNGAGLAIPDFPLVFGGLLPPQWNFPIAIHFAHRVGAVAVTLMILLTTAGVFRREWAQRQLRTPSVVLLLLVAVQITLGALTVLSQKHYIINSLHVVTGGTVLITSLVLTLRLHRSRLDRTGDGRLVGQAA